MEDPAVPATGSGRVLISYAHDDPVHEAQVLEFSEFLRAHGIDALIDVEVAVRPQYFGDWMSEQIRQGGYVLVIGSPDYRAAAEDRLPAQQRKGTRWEARLLKDAFYLDHDAARDRILPVLLPGRTVEDLPDWLSPGAATYYPVTSFTVAGAEELLRVLTTQPASRRPLRPRPESLVGPYRSDERRPDAVPSQKEGGLRREAGSGREVDSPLRLPAPDLPTAPRSALVVATSEYVDPALRTLRAPATDAVAFAEVLDNPAIGGFSVSSEIDRTDYELRIAIQDFLSDRSPEEIVLLYVSCHGVTDKWRRLYFAATNTVKTRLAATGLEADWVLRQLEDCQARSQLVILDCCFSGAFSLGAKGDDDLNLSQFISGRGRAVLTASNAREYAFEQGLAGDPVEGTPAPGSIFTAALLDGLRTGAADKDNNGYITVEEAYTYAYQQVRSKGTAQTPQRWLYGGEGDILLGRNPLGRTIRPAAVTDALRNLLEHPYPDVRITAVQRLSRWLTSEDPAQAVTARRELGKVADEDIPRVATVARSLLDANPSLRWELPRNEGSSLDEIAVDEVMLSEPVNELPEGEPVNETPVDDETAATGPASDEPPPRYILEGVYVGTEPPEGYVIKGNERSMKYHMPDTGGYARTIAEVWFNSEEAAQQAGFVRAQR